MKVLAITLARGGSQSIPRKNIVLIDNKPLIWYTIIEAKKSKLINRYIVSTDDIEIKDVCMQFGAEVPFLRPAELSENTSTSVEALQHAVKWCEKQDNIKYDIIVELMCTNPMKTHVDIDSAIRKLIETDADSVIGVSKLDDHHPARIKKIVDDKIQDFCTPELSSRRQDLKPDAYIRNGSIYVLNRNKLMIEGIRFGSENSRPYYMSPEKSVNIDIEMDIHLAKLMIKKYNLHE